MFFITILQSVECRDVIHSLLQWQKGKRHGMSKGVKDGCRSPTLRVATPETAVRLFHEWSLAGSRRVGHGNGNYNYKCSSFEVLIQCNSIGSRVIKGELSLTLATKSCYSLVPNS
jgi:hypothetical protein